MALYHMHAKVIGRSSGRSATAAAAYRAGEQIRDDRTGELHDYSRRGGVIHSEIVAPDNAPEWMKDRAQLWNAVEAAEKRKDAQLSREVRFALPHELTDQQRLELVRDYTKQAFVDRGMVADIAIHAPSRDGDERNHHAHIMLTMRELTGDGFGNKAREWNDKELCIEWRRELADHTNRILEREGFPDRVTEKSFGEIGIEKEATFHLGPTASALERQGIASDIGDENRAIEERNAERERLQSELKALDAEKEALEKERNADLTPAQIEAIRLREELQAEADRKAAEEKRRQEQETARNEREERARSRLAEAQAMRFWAAEKDRRERDKSEMGSLIDRQRERLWNEERHDAQEREARTTGLRGLVNRVRDWVDPVGARRREAEEMRQSHDRHLSRFNRDTTERQDLEREQRERAEREKAERLRREAEERARLEAELRRERERQRQRELEEERRRQEELRRQLSRGRGDDWDRGR